MSQGDGAAHYTGGPGVAPASLTALCPSRPPWIIMASDRQDSARSPSSGLLSATAPLPGWMARGDCPQVHAGKAERGSGWGLRGGFCLPLLSMCVCCFLTETLNTAMLTRKYFYCWSLGFLVSFSLNG